MTDLRKIVIDRIESVGVKEAAKFYGVSVGTASNWATGKTPPSIDALQLTLADLELSVGDAPEPKDLFMWEGRKVALLFPVYRTINPDTHFTLFANYAKYGPEKIAMPKPIKGTCIWEARNRMIDNALKITSINDFMMVDDDMIMPFGYPDHFNAYYNAGLPAEIAGQNTISRLMSHPDTCGIVGVTYFGRHKKGRSQCAFGFLPSLHEDQKLRTFQYKGLVPMDWVGTGVIRIKRWVLEKMKEAIDGGKWPECKPKHEDKWYGYFNPIQVGVGEDVSFCTRAKQLGIQSYLDASLVCLHNGEENFGPNNTKA